MNIHDKLLDLYGQLSLVRCELQELTDKADPSQPYEVKSKLIFTWLDRVNKDLETLVKKVKKSSVEDPNFGKAIV